MILRLSSSAPRATIVFVGLMLGVTLSYYSIRNARAEFQAGLGTPWTRIETSWNADKDAHGVGICVTRYASEKLESKIQGTAWADDLALIPENAGTAKP